MDRQTLVRRIVILGIFILVITASKSPKQAAIGLVAFGVIVFIEYDRHEKSKQVNRNNYNYKIKKRR